MLYKTVGLNMNFKQFLYVKLNIKNNLQTLFKIEFVLKKIKKLMRVSLLARYLLDYKQDIFLYYKNLKQ